MQDGALWLVEHRPHVRLVGLDYLSVAVYEDVVGPHVVLLGNVRMAVYVGCRVLIIVVFTHIHPHHIHTHTHTGYHCSRGFGTGQGGCRLVSAALSPTEHCWE